MKIYDSGVDKNSSFLRYGKDLILLDYNLVADKYDTSRSYVIPPTHLRKFYSFLGIPLSFSKTFFEIDRMHARSYFSNLADFSGITVYSTDKSGESLGFLSGDRVQKNAIKVVEKIESMQGQLHFYQSPDLLSSQDFFCLDESVRNGVAVQVNLLKERAYVYQVEEDNQRIYLLHDFSTNLNVDDSEFYFDIEMPDLYNAYDFDYFYSPIKNTVLSVKESLDVLKSLFLVIGKGRHLDIINRGVFIDVFNTDNLLQVVHGNKKRELLITPSNLTVDGAIGLIYASFFGNEQIGIDDIAWFYKKLWGRELDFYAYS